MLTLFIFFGLSSAIVGTFVAVEKNRSPWEGFLLGLILNFVGLLLESCLPNREIW